MKTSTMTNGERATWVAVGLLFLLTFIIGWGAVILTWEIPATGACDLVSCR